MTLSEKFSQRLADMRAQKNLSQEEFAACCGLNNVHYGMIERNHRCPTLKTVERICEGLHVQPAEMLDFETIPPEVDEGALLMQLYFKQMSMEDRQLAIGILKLMAKKNEKSKRKTKPL